MLRENRIANLTRSIASWCLIGLEAISSCWLLSLTAVGLPLLVLIPLVHASSVAANQVDTETNRSTGVISTSLVQGTVGPRVQELQQQLKQKGFDPGPADGVFGLQTKIAVAAFQKSQGLLVDGIAGASTLAALGIKSQMSLPAPQSPLNPDSHDPSPVPVANQLYWAGSEGNLGLAVTGKFTSIKHQADAFNLMQEVGTFQGKTWQLKDILVAVDFNANGRVVIWKVSGPRSVIAQYLDTLRTGYKNRLLLSDFSFSFINFQPSAAIEK